MTDNTQETVEIVQLTTPVRYDVGAEEIAKLVSKYGGLTVKNENDHAGAAKVREGRLTIKKTRTAIEHKRKELKAESIKYGKAVDTEAKRLTGLLNPTYDHLEAQEAIVRDAQKRREAEEARLREIETNRRLDLLRSIEVTWNARDVELMRPEDWEHEFNKAEKAYIYRKATEQRAADELAATQKRLDEERAEAEQTRLDLEAERQRIANEAAALKAQIVEVRQGILDQYNARIQPHILAEMPEQEFADAVKVAKAEHEAKVKAAEEAEARRVLVAERQGKLAAFGAIESSDVDLGTIDQEHFDTMLADTKSRHDALIADQEAQRIQAEADEKARKDAEAAAERQRKADGKPYKKRLQAYLEAVVALTPPSAPKSHAKRDAELVAAVATFEDEVRAIIDRI